MMRGALPLWLLTLTARRARGSWRLLLIVTAIALAACTLVTSVGLLISATEQGGVRAALGSLSAAQSSINVQLFRPSVSVAEGRELTDKSVATVLGDAASSTSDAVAVTEFMAVPQFDTDIPTLSYFGEFDGVQRNATLVDGSWATAGGGGDAVPVSIPKKAATSLKLAIGSTFTVSVDGADVTARVVGVFTPRHPNGAYWARDQLSGAGNIVGFPKPGSRAYTPTHAFGPLIVGPGGLASAHIPVAYDGIAYTPDFSTTTVEQLASLLDRLADAQEDVPLHIGLVADHVNYASELADETNNIASALVVTRSTVVVVSLLLLVLALAALAQTARLLNEARADERRPMRARGGSDGQLLSLAIIEAALIGTVTAALAPLLARLVYRALAVQPPMVAAGMPPDSGLPPLGWYIAAGVSFLFVIVLVAPLLRRSPAFGAAEGAAAERGRGRQRRASGIMRSGLDLGLVVLAGVVYWQLQAYRTPVGDGASLSIDPVLVAGPAIMLLAGALLAVRLIPLLARLVERLGARSRGALLPLASWEVGRRSQRVIAAVLLLTLTLAVGTFSQTFLATWRLSQVDQAQLAIGAPVRVPADAKLGGAQAAVLESGADGRPQPVIRRLGTLTGPGMAYVEADAPGGASTLVLGVTPRAAAMIDRGRLGEEGGATIHHAIDGALPKTSSVSLPGDVRGVGATVRIGDAASPRSDISARMYALLDDANGLVSTVDLGAVPMDGLDHRLQGLLPELPRGARPGALRFVGFQASFLGTNPQAQDDGAETPADILVKDLAAVQPAPDDYVEGDPLPVTPVTWDADESWKAQSSVPYGSAPVAGEVPEGWQLRLAVAVPSSVSTQSAQFVLMGWTPQVSMPAVLTDELAKHLSVGPGVGLTVVLPGAQVGVLVAATVPLVPGSLAGVQPDASSTGNESGQPDTVVLDQRLLSRALAQAGVPVPAVDEWWVDVKPGHARAYLDAHPNRAGVPAPDSSELKALGMQQDPMRVSAQAGLWLAILGAGLLSIAGFAVHTAAAMKARRTELAQLRAIGLSRRMLVALVGAESLVLGVLGTVFGVAIGVLIGWLVGPLIAVSPGGTPTLPAVRVIVPWDQVALFAALLAVVLAIVVLAVARAQRSTDPASILRGADE